MSPQMTVIGLLLAILFIALYKSGKLALLWQASK